MQTLNFESETGNLISSQLFTESTVIYKRNTVRTSCLIPIDLHLKKLFSFWDET